MSEMSARLTLTFNDLGSPGLRAFQALIESIGPKVTGLSQRFNTLERSIGRVGEAATAGVAKLNAYEGSINKTTSSIEAAAKATTTLEEASTALGTILRLATSIANSLATAYSAIATSAGEVAGRMTSAGAAIGGANTQLAIMEGRVHGITGALRGMAEVWAASKMFKAGGASATEASEMQMLEARMKALNLGPAQNVEMIQKSAALSAEVKFLSTREALESRLALLTGIGRNTSEINDPNVNNILDKTLPTIINTARILQARGDTSKFTDIVFNLGGIMEARGLTSQPERMNETADLMQRALASTGGKVNIKDVETVLRNMKYGERAMVDDEGVALMIPLINQAKAMGHGGGSSGQGVSQVGTMFSMMAKFAEAGVRNKESINMLTTMGLYDSSHIGTDTSTTSVNTSAGGLKYSEELLRNPEKWVMDRFAPAAIRLAKDNPKRFAGGKDLNDPRVLDEAIMKIIISIFSGQGGQNVAQGFALGTQAGPASQMQSEAALTGQSKKVPEAMKDLEQTFNQSVKGWDAALHNLELAFGENLLPALTAFLNQAAGFVRFLNDVIAASPAAASVTAIALGIGAVTLAVVGLNRLFGIWPMLTSLVGAGATAATGFGAAWVGGSTAITGALAVVGLAIKRMIPLAAAFMVGWDAGTIIGQLDAGGRSIQTWVTGYMNAIVETFDRGWTRVKAFVGLITDAQKNVLLKDSSDRQKSIESGLDPKNSKAGSWGVGATGSWGDPEKKHSETPEEKMRREKAAAADLLPHRIYTPLDKNAGKLMPNLPAAQDKQDARLAMAQEADALRVLDAAYHATQIGIEEYYSKKQEMILTDSGRAIAALKKELADLEGVTKGRRDEIAIIRVTTDIKLAEDRTNSLLSANESNKVKDINTLKKTLMDSERQLDALQGHRHLAELKRLDEEAEKRRQYLMVNAPTMKAQGIDVPAEFQKVEDARTAGRAAADYDKMYRALKAQLDEYKQKEQDITDAVLAGTETQHGAELKVWQINRDIGALIDSQIVKMRELAVASGQEPLIKQVGDLARVSKKDLEILSPEVLKIKGVLESGFAKFFADVANGTTTIRQSFMSLFTTIAQGITNLVSKSIAEDLVKKMFGSSGGQSIIGLFGGTAGFFGNGPSGSKTPGDYGPTPSGGNIDTGSFGNFGSWISNLFSFDTGIDKVPSDMVAMIHKDEAVLKPADAASYRSGSLPGQGARASVTNNFVVSNSTSRAAQLQIAVQVASGIVRAQRRNG